MWIVVGAHAPLFHDDLHFLGELLLGKLQIHHAVGLELERQREFRFVQLLVVGGVIARGERVVTASGSGNDPGEFTARHFLRTLEHHVLEHVRHARSAAYFIHAAGAIPHHGHHHWRAVILFDDHLQAVAQRALHRVRRATCRRHADQRQRQRQHRPARVRKFIEHAYV